MHVTFNARFDDLSKREEYPEVESIFLNGNLLYLYDEHSTMLARAELFQDHNRLLWRLKRGQRGHEIGEFTTLVID